MTCSRLPAGHAIIDVDAASEEEAIQKAMEEVTIDHIETWEAVKQFNKGNVCYCPRPWEAEAENQDES